MDRERYQRIREILHEANRRSGKDRRAYIESRCGGDAELRSEVERLLESDPVPTGHVAPPLPEPDEPPEVLGPYRIERELGRGGMGVVYAASDARTDRRVALKVLRPHFFGAAELVERLRRECEVGSRVLHENVVRVYGLEEAGEPRQLFLVMEQVEGSTLQEQLARLGAVPEGLLREVARQAAAGLAAIHAEGIIHRDIKPANVLLTQDERIVIMDLGIAKLQEATEVLTREGQFLGSLGYAAPEQFEAEAVDARADLYSLGVVLYELATGANPFQHELPGASIRAHLDYVPPPAAQLNPDLSPFLSEVLATLLRKRPEERFRSAVELGRVLREGETGSWWSEREGAGVRLPELAVRRETSLRGRELERAFLEDAWRRACRKEGCAIVLEGEAGLGKTRMLDEFLRRMDPRGVHVLYGCDLPEGGLVGLRDAIRRKFGERDLEAALGPYLRTTPALVPAFAAFVRGDSLPSGATELKSDALAVLCCQLLQALAAERPTVWLMDDLHFTSAEGRDVAAALARCVPGHRAMVLLTARPGTLRTLPEGADRLPLRRLSPSDVVLLLRDAGLSEDLVDRLGATIARKSDGVPFFVFEMIRGLEEGGFLEQRPEGTYVQTRAIERIDVPSAVRDLVAVRLGEVDAKERALLDLGAVLGFEFDAELLAEALGRPLVGVLQTLAEIERRHGLVRARGRRYRFDHHQILDVLYEDLPERLREEYHSALATAYEKRLGGAPASDADARFLAHHHLRGSRPGKGIAHLERALEHLTRQFLNTEAVELAERALGFEGLLTGGARAHTILAMVTRRHMSGDVKSSEHALEEARRIADEAGDASLRVRVRLSLARHLVPTRRGQDALALLDEAESIAKESGDRGLESNVSGARSFVFIQLGRPRDAEPHARRQLEIALEQGDPHSRARALGRLGACALEQGRIDEAHALLEENLAASREAGDPWTETSTIGNLGILSRAQGRFEQALLRYELYYSLSRQYAYRMGEVIGGLNLANLKIELGRSEEARQDAELAQRFAREFGHPRLDGFARMTRGLQQAVYGSPARARELYHEALEIFCEHGDKTGEAECRYYLGRLEAGEGNADSAVDHLDRAIEMAAQRDVLGSGLSARAERALLPGGDASGVAAEVEAHGTRIEYPARMAIRFLLWRATGDRSHLREAHRLLMDLRDRAPEVDRERMLAVVPLHRDILAAAQRAS